MDRSLYVRPLSIAEAKAILANAGIPSQAKVRETYVQYKEPDSTARRTVGPFQVIAIELCSVIIHLYLQYSSPPRRGWVIDKYRIAQQI